MLLIPPESKIKRGLPPIHRSICADCEPLPSAARRNSPAEDETTPRKPLKAKLFSVRVDKLRIPAEGGPLPTYNVLEAYRVRQALAFVPKSNRLLLLGTRWPATFSWPVMVDDPLDRKLIMLKLASVLVPKPLKNTELEALRLPVESNPPFAMARPVSVVAPVTARVLERVAAPATKKVDEALSAPAT